MNLGNPPAFTISYNPGALLHELKRQKQRLGDATPRINILLYDKIKKELARGNISFKSQKERRYAIAVIQKENDFIPLLKTKINPLLGEYVRDGANAKKLLKLYYSKYIDLYENGNIETLKNYIFDILKTKKTINGYLTEFVNSTSTGDFTRILTKHADISLDMLRERFGIKPDDQFFIQLRNLKIISENNKLAANQNGKELFHETLQYKQYKSFLPSNRLVGEEVVWILIKKLQSSQAKCNALWEQYILDLVGDPRDIRNEYAWYRIGSDFKQYFEGHLSKGDLIDFLESISDGRGDDVYHERKKFWKKYLKSVVGAKLVVCERDENHIRQHKPSLYEKFEKYPNTYGKLKNNADKSYILIDFGKVKVIEGTRQTSVRFYSEIPKWFASNIYSLHDTSDFIRYSHQRKDQQWQINVALELKKHGVLYDR